MTGADGGGQRRTEADGVMRIGVLTVSDMGAQGRREDSSGDAIQAWAEGQGYDVVVRSVVPDETALIAGKLSRWADSGEVDVVLTWCPTRRRSSPASSAAGRIRAKWTWC